MIDDEKQYLVIELDESDTKGVFLFLHKSLDEPCEADLWFADIEGAKRQAKFNYGIEIDDWQTLEL
ncbi:MAG: hypothetical protein WAU21_08515 [Chitinophagales bacterium]|nr:hypothetical protein [Bacteroidota bacterium]MBK8488310.1 hypothetical protein [Bacteroidota bacterium]MBK8681929.1 hypothetical protein [Bacteroidota bacterium]MBP7540593.1 hypothetical protein [Saprospiraceae bacterium]MBP8892702.1 hypothetical protein [Saprospiraceae bacterium]